MNEKPTIETLINRIETAKEKDKLIESTKEFFEPLKKLYFTKRYFFPSNSLIDNCWTIKQEVVEEPLYIEYRYSTDCKIIVLIKFNLGRNSFDVDNIISNVLTKKDFDFPLESESLKIFAHLIKERGKDHKVKKETKSLLEAAKNKVKEDIKSIIYSYYFQVNDGITHNKIRSAISKNITDRFGVDYNFNVHSFKINDSWLGGFEFKISSELFNWVVSLTTDGITFEEKRGI